MTWITIDEKPYDEKLNEIEKLAKSKGYTMVTLHLLELKDGELLVEYDVVVNDNIVRSLYALGDREAMLKYIAMQKL